MEEQKRNIKFTRCILKIVYALFAAGLTIKCQDRRYRINMLYFIFMSFINYFMLAFIFIYLFAKFITETGSFWLGSFITLLVLFLGELVAALLAPIKEIPAEGENGPSS